MTEGSADEYGSLSFNQVLYHYRYSDTPCQVHGRQGLNHFDPRENLMGFAVHTGGADPQCGGSFNWAFARTEGEAGALVRRHQDTNLLGYMKDGQVIKAGAGDLEDDYELLARAIGLYNGANDILAQNDTWPEVLSQNVLSRDSSGKGNKDGKCYSCFYAINIRNTHFGLPLRDYVWVGERQPLTIKDGAGNTITNPLANQPVWCFAYGEREWRAGTSFDSVSNAAQDTDEFNRPQTPVGRIDCTTGVLLP